MLNQNKQNMNIPEEDLILGYFYLLTRERGYVDVLNKINGGLSEYFGMMGYIHIGIDGAGHIRFGITDFGRTQALAMFTALARKKIESEVKEAA